MFACSYGLSQLFQSVLRAYLRAGPTVLRARKPYSRIAAIAEAFKIVNTNVLEAEQRRQLQAEPFLNEQISGNLQQAQTLFAEAAPKLAERLIKLGLDERVKGYTAVSAISEAFKILQQGVIDKEHRDQLNAIRSTLEQIEGAAPDVIDV